MSDNTYILNHKRLKEILEDYDYQIDDLATDLDYNSDTLIHSEEYRILNYAIGIVSVNESTLTINRNLAKAFKDNGMEACCLDVNKLLLIMNATGTTIFKTNEKILITCMIFNYPEIILWDESSIFRYAKVEVDIKLDKAKIKDTLANSDAFVLDKTTGKYRLNIDVIVSRMNKEAIVVADDETEVQN